MSEFSHFNKAGNAHMVDVGEKPSTHRVAMASGIINMQPETLDLILKKGHKKGDVLSIARIAGIMAAKRTADLIPLCHPIPITKVEIELTPDRANHHVRCQAQAETYGRTGIEMEALTAVHVTLLTIYDMCKAVDRGMTFTNIGLDEKSGGKSGYWRRKD